MTLGVRVLSEEEREALGRIARSRTVGAGQVRRAQIVLHALEGLKAPEISARMDLCGATVRHWLERFNARGLEGLEEDVRSRGAWIRGVGATTPTPSGVRRCGRSSGVRAPACG